MGKIKSIIKSKWFKRTIIILIVLLIGFRMFSNMTKKKAQEALSKLESVEVANVVKGDIYTTISGSGTVSPIERYDIVPLVIGDILYSPYDVGDIVKKDDLLYEIDHEDADINIERMQNNIRNQKITIEETLDSIKKLTIYAPSSGQLTDFFIKEGEQVAPTKIGQITDVNNLVAVVPFNSSQIAYIQEGQSVTIGIEKFMMNVKGVVKSKSSVSKAQSVGAVLYDVEIKLSNPGAIPVGTMVTATVHTPNGDMVSPSAGVINYPESVSLMCEGQGIVKKLYVRNNDWVEKGQKIAELSNDTLKNSYDRALISLRDSELSLESSKKSLENYFIKSPIDGVVITKNYKAGDTIDQNQQVRTLMVVADMSKMVFTIDADELDIALIKLGQKVLVEADALPDEEFIGTVTEIASEGVSQNGVTTYAVEVTIDEPKSLRPGMNVSAEIVINESQNTLILPKEAVNDIVDDYGIVYVKDENIDISSEGNEEENDLPSDDKNKPNKKDEKKQDRANIPPNSRPQKVKVGIRNEREIEILEGLSEGDEVYYYSLRVEGSSIYEMMGGMGGPPSRGPVH